MKRFEMVQLQHSLEKLKKIPGTVKFAYAVARNIHVIRNETKAYPTFNDIKSDMERERIAVCELHAKKDADGKPVIVDKDADGKKQRVYDIPGESRPKLDADLSVLQEKTRKRYDELRAFMDEDAGAVAIHKVNLDELPDNITAEQIENIMEIIKEVDAA